MNLPENIPEGAIFLEHNMYVPGHGYLIDHIPVNQQRGNSAHWDDQYTESGDFENSWKPRSGPIQFVERLAHQTSDILNIINLGAGLGDFSVDLAKIPNTYVYHVDFSETGNRVARQKIQNANVEDAVEIITSDNNIFLQNFLEQGKRADVVFLYGASGSNEPSDIEYGKTLELCAAVLKEGGFLWSVGMLQPRLIDPLDIRVPDVLGDFPKAPGLATRFLEKAGMVLIRETIEPRPDFHPLVPGGPAMHHIHLAGRALYMKPLGDGTIPSVPEFGFVDAVK